MYRKSPAWGRPLTYCAGDLTSARRALWNPGGPQIATDRLPPNVYGRFDAPQRPSQPPQRDHLLLLFFAQDIAHVDGGYSSRRDQCPESVHPLPGFQPIIIGRFWVIPEAQFQFLRRPPQAGPEVCERLRLAITILFGNREVGFGNTISELDQRCGLISRWLSSHFSFCSGSGSERVRKRDET